MKANVKFLLAGLLLLLSGNGFSLVLAEQTNVLCEDSLRSPVYHLRVPDAEVLNPYREDSAFNYIEKKSEMPQWWLRFLNWINDFFGKHHWQVEDNTPILNIIIKVLASLLVVFLIYKLIRSKYSFPFARKEQYFAMDGEHIPENVDGISYPLLLENAISVKNYTLAVRIHYLYVLHLLDCKGIVSLDNHKTNVTYVYEIKDSKIKMIFSNLSRIFDCVCYGEFEIDEPMFRLVEEEFKEFQKEIGG